MAIPLIPFAGLTLSALNALSLAAIATLLADRSVGNDSPTVSPEPQEIPFTPPFSGGQCLDTQYLLAYRVRQFQNGGLINTSFRTFPQTESIRGAVTFIGAASIDNGDSANGSKVIGRNPDGSPITRINPFGFSNASNVQVIVDQIQLQPFPNQSDDCGDLPNPNAPVPPSVGGGSLLPVPDENPIIVHQGIIAPVGGGILAALAALAALIANSNAVLDGIKAIGDAIGKIKEWLEEKEKEEPKNRTVWAGRWVSMPVEGGFEVVTQLIDGQVLSPFQVQIEVESFPVTCSRRLGVLSPSFANEEPIGYLFIRSSNGGYSEPVSIRFLRNSISINEDTRGLSFSFKENPLALAKIRVWYSSAPPSL